MLENVFILNGTFFLVTDDVDSLPRLSTIASSAINPTHPPRRQDWQILSVAEAVKTLGKFGGRYDPNLPPYLRNVAHTVSLAYNKQHGSRQNLPTCKIHTQYSRFSGPTAISASRIPLRPCRLPACISCLPTAQAWGWEACRTSHPQSASGSRAYRHSHLHTSNSLTARTPHRERGHTQVRWHSHSACLSTNLSQACTRSSSRPRSPHSR